MNKRKKKYQRASKFSEKIETKIKRGNKHEKKSCKTTSFIIYELEKPPNVNQIPNRNLESKLNHFRLLRPKEPTPKQKYKKYYIFRQSSYLQYYSLNFAFLIKFQTQYSYRKKHFFSISHHKLFHFFFFLFKIISLKSLDCL